MDHKPVDFETHKLYAMSPGVDFPQALVKGVIEHFKDKPPHALARTQIILNTERMRRRVRDLFLEQAQGFLPKLHLVTHLDDLLEAPDQRLAIPPLVSRFELVQLIDTLITAQPDLAARSSLFSLADSLAKLIDEMQGEGVSAEDLRDLDVSDQSGHWQRSKAFFYIAQTYLEARQASPDQVILLRETITQLAAHWQSTPPDAPVILAGSTGSRGLTLEVMKHVVKLPHGCLVLPGFDFEMPRSVWEALKQGSASEDHPQARLAHILKTLDKDVKDVRHWPVSQPANKARNAFISLALRPAPVTDVWLRDGPNLPSLRDAVQDMTLIEAPDPRQEALAIAVRIRQAVEERQVSALISPDRQLTRQVSAALSRWGIVPDDSAGVPLHLSAVGRFLRQTAALMFAELTSSKLIALLNHPLTHSKADRNQHLLWTRELELYLRKEGFGVPKPSHVASWCIKRSEPAVHIWAEWLSTLFWRPALAQEDQFEAYFSHHLTLSEAIAKGSRQDAAGESLLWAGEAGEAAKRACDQIREAAHHAGDISLRDYAEILGAVLAGEEVRDAVVPRSDVLIWGTLEARVQGADLVILGGLNEGSWPKQPDPDPWLNRAMRAEVGLLLPERQIGLSAHDFQQAITVKDVVLTRSVRSDGAETVPSRWLNRMSNLLNGLEAQGGPKILKALRQRGAHYLKLAEALEHAEQRSPRQRPMPCPPVAARPTRLSVTEIKTLIRDPYAIYAKYVLGLKPLDPLDEPPSNRLRGIIEHNVLENFMRNWADTAPEERLQQLQQIYAQHLAERVPFDFIKIFWASRFFGNAEQFIQDEVIRQENFVTQSYEATGAFDLKELNLTLVSRADRLHLTHEGTIEIYDYKTGTAPTASQQNSFDKQLYLMALIAENGGFEGVDPAPVSHAAFLGVGSKLVEVPAPMAQESFEDAWKKFRELLAKYRDPAQGYSPRRALFKAKDYSPYDQLSRFGEWDLAATPVREDLS